jgi:hypothetical protein
MAARGEPLESFDLDLVLHEFQRACELLGHNDRTDQRLALILSDNAAELLLYWRVSEAVKDDQTKEQAGLTCQWTAKQRRQALYDFGPALDFCETKVKCVQADDATILREIHKFRNEAYHRAVRREENLRISPVSTHLETVGHLLPELVDGHWGNVRPSNCERLQYKFGVTVGDRCSLEKSIRKMLDSLYQTKQMLPYALGEDIERRVSSINHLLGVVSKATGDRVEELLTRAQSPRGQSGCTAITAKELANWMQKAVEIKNLCCAGEALTQWWAIENELSEVEPDVLMLFWRYACKSGEQPPVTGGLPSTGN